MLSLCHLWKYCSQKVYCGTRLHATYFHLRTARPPKVRRVQCRRALLVKANDLLNPEVQGLLCSYYLRPEGCRGRGRCLSHQLDSVPGVGWVVFDEQDGGLCESSQTQRRDVRVFTKTFDRRQAAWLRTVITHRSAILQPLLSFTPPPATTVEQHLSLAFYQNAKVSGWCRFFVFE